MRMTRSLISSAFSTTEVPRNFGGTERLKRMSAAVERKCVFVVDVCSGQPSCSSRKQNIKMATRELSTKKQSRFFSRVASVTGTIIFMGVLRVFAADQQTSAVTAFRNFLTSTKLDAQWENGDLMQIDSAELRAAYGGRQFYFTFKPAPLPPGAAFPSAIARYKAALEEYSKHSLRLTVGVDQALNVTKFQLANDFN